jgi:DNA-binding phage protein
MLTLQDAGLTEKDAQTSRWNRYERLDCEEKISAFIEAAQINIEEGDSEPEFIFQALATAATARSINQIAKQSNIDRKVLCDLFVQKSNTPKSPQVNPAIISKITKAFLVSQPI